MEQNEQTYNNKKAYIVGGGIASLASAVYLIKNGQIPGKNITIIEESNSLGGSLDGKGSPETGYISRGARMFSEEVYSCTFDLLSMIPLNKNSSKTLLDDFIDFNKKVKIYSKARLVQKGKIIDSVNLELSIEDGISMVKMMSLPEYFLSNTVISDHFSLSFFKTNFWFEWCTTFAFQPWHSAIEFKRYILRFIQEFPRMNTLTGGRCTRYTQYESIILPIYNWLKDAGVNFITDSYVFSLNFIKNDNKEQVSSILYLNKNTKKEIAVNKNDLVFLTNGSITANSTFGSMKNAPILKIDPLHDPWMLWKNISKDRPHFGDPSAFDDHIDRSKWGSFSVTFKNNIFMDLMENFSKNEPGTGGITTIKDSNWLISVATPHQPHFLNQSSNVNVFWGYGLFPDKKGNYIHKKMSECTGEEILTEICSHLGFTKEIPTILESANCIPCMMPYITSQFLPRKIGDRPLVIPKNTKNLAFIGQFCEIPDEIVFTVEHSVRSAMIAVHKLLKIKKEIPAIYKGQFDPKTIKDFFIKVFSLKY
ncbi:MAG: oleate hydratase [Minisyncoccota bacterium]